MEEITSRNNPAVKAAAALKELRERKSTGLFLLEGARLCKDAALNGVRITQFFITEKAREKYKVKIDIDDHFPYMFAEPFVHYYDSLGVQIDSATWEYRFTCVERSDTVYEGLKMTIRVDSTAVIDSLPKADSLVVSDSSAAVDAVKDVPVKNVEVKLLKEKAPVNNARKKENAVLKNELKLLKDE